MAHQRIDSTPKHTHKYTHTNTHTHIQTRTHIPTQKNTYIWKIYVPIWDGMQFDVIKMSKLSYLTL